MARVLVVEDDANNLDVASRIIRASGHEALVAADGVAGLDLARVERPDAILVDLLLPRMDGWSLTRSLRTEPWAASIPIIAVSALALPSDRACAERAAGPDPARRHDAGDRRLADVPAPQVPAGDRGHPGHLRHREGSVRGSKQGVRGRRRRLPDETVRAGRARSPRAERDLHEAPAGRAAKDRRRSQAHGAVAQRA